MSKYEEVLKKISGSSTVDQLLRSTDLTYSAKVMVVFLLLKFRTLLQIEMYDGSNDASKLWRHSRLKCHYMASQGDSILSIPPNIERLGVSVVRSLVAWYDCQL